MNGATRIGADARGTTPPSSSCMSGPSRRKEPSAPRSTSSTTWRKPASPPSSSCRSPISRDRATGAMTACCSMRRTAPMDGPTTCARSSMPRISAASWCCSTSSTTTSGPKEIIAAATRRNSSPRAPRPGARPSTIGAPKCAPMRSGTRCIGCGIIASTACGSMAFTPFWGAGRRAGSARRGEPAVPAELSRAPGELAAATGRAIHLVLENDDNNARLLDPRTDPPRGRYRAQWNDDYHHAWHVLLTGETHGYYGDYAEAPLDRIVRALSSGFAYQGEPSAHRDGKPRGEPSAGLPPTAFVDFLQNHDQIGNRALGDRLESQVAAPAMEAAPAILLLPPPPPLMFMGEEWGSLRPFPFFCDFKGALADAVRKGRREEFKSAYQKLGDDIPDPLDARTFRSAILDWEECGREAGRRRLGLVRELLTLRHDRVVPLLADLGFDGGTCRGAVRPAAAGAPDGRRLLLLANLSDAAAPRRADHRGGAPLWGGEPAAPLPPWSVFWSLAAPGRRPPGRRPPSPPRPF